MIDLHCHLLPGIDDGPIDETEALALAHAQVAAGVHEVACTPHVSHTYRRNDAALIARATASLQERLIAAGVPLRLHTGGEVAVSRAIDLTDEELHALHLGDGPWLLLEAPLGSELPRLEQLVQGLHARGHRPLLAHPERCATFHHDPQLLGTLVRGGALAQVTASSLAGGFGRTVQKFARSMVDEGLVQVISSDAHDARRRPPGLAEPLHAAELDYLIPWAVQEVPAAILSGSELPPPPPTPQRRRGMLRRR